MEDITEADLLIAARGVGRGVDGEFVSEFARVCVDGADVLSDESEGGLRATPACCPLAILFIMKSDGSWQVSLSAI